MINQGDLFWMALGDLTGSEPGFLRPHVVIQNNVFNRSRINTVVVCALTPNSRRAKAPGNALLEKGEASLPKQSVVNVSQIFTIDKRDLGEKSGTISLQPVRQILDGIHLVLEPRDLDQ